MQALRAEVATNGTDEDKECLEYVLDKEAGGTDHTFPNGKRDCDAQGNVLPSRQGKRLADFVAHPSASTAKLREARIFYSSPTRTVPPPV